MVSDAMGKNLPFMKEKLCCGYTACSAADTSMKTISCVKSKESFLLSPPHYVGTDPSLC